MAGSPITNSNEVGGMLLGGFSGLNLVKSQEEQDQQQKALDNLNKTDVPTYQVTPGVSALAGQYFNPEGVSSTQRNVFNNDLSENNNTAYSNAVSHSGGQIGGFLQGVLNTSNSNAINRFADTDAQTRQSNKAMGVGGINTIQHVSEANTQAAITRRMLIEQALGAAIAKQKQNQSDTLGMLGGEGASFLGFGLGKGQNSQGKKPNYPSYSTDGKGDGSDAMQFQDDGEGNTIMTDSN